MDKMKQSFKMANRIKDLRKEKAEREGRKTISHEFLSSEIKRIYGVDVKKDSLINYEISEKDRTKAENTPNLKMRVEVLLCLADYFGVSLDYLVGRSNIRRDEINGVLAVDLGLSDLAITNLLELSEWGNKYCERFVNTTNFLLEQETKPPTSAGFIDDCGNLVDAFDSEYASWESKGYIPLLTVIDEFLTFEEDGAAFYDLMEDGKIVSVPKSGRFNIGSVKTVNASAIIERVLLDDIEEKLKRLRDKRRSQE